jgi:hypothetical protein
MTWLMRYRIRNYVQDALWILPSLSTLAAMALVPFSHWGEEAMGWESSFHPETARAVLGTMAASMFTFIVFVSSALLVSVQLASSQLTPRIIALVFRDPVTRFSLTLFAFTFTLRYSDTRNHRRDSACNHSAQRDGTGHDESGDCREQLRRHAGCYCRGCLRPDFDDWRAGRCTVARQDHRRRPEQPTCPVAASVCGDG